MKFSFLQTFSPILFLFLISISSMGQTGVQALNTDGILTFSVLTITNNATYSPKNVLAIWVKDAQGNFVVSRKVMAASRKQHLVKWVASSNNNSVTAITGATLPNHQLHNISWDCRNDVGNLMSDGLYEIWVEFTERNSASGGAVGPSTKVTFTKGTEVVSINPPDEAYFSNMSLNYSPLNVGVDENLKPLLKFNTFPNPFNDRLHVCFELPISSFINISVYDLSGKRIAELVNEKLPQGVNNFIWEGDVDGGKRINPGIYFIRIVYGEKLFMHKVIFGG
ncbi:MAG: T9SS type A sorting domain-containing protein [Lentimicrobium sp.]|nr:T9SS type A sorting domain-containing protein [Lentimicrobium sp.]